MKPLTEDQKYLIKEIRARRSIAKQMRFINRSENCPRRERKRMTRTPMDLGEHLEERALYPFTAEDTVEARAEKLRQRKSIRNAQLYGTDDYVTTSSKQPMARAKSRRSNLEKLKLGPGLPDLESKKISEKIHKKALKAIRQGTKYQLTASDRMIPGKQKHLLTGKRGIGKTD